MHFSAFSGHPKIIEQANDVNKWLDRNYFFLAYFFVFAYHMMDWASKKKGLLVVSK